MTTIYLPETETGKSEYVLKVFGSESDKLLRELGSIHQSDLTLVCSPYELKLLTTTYLLRGRIQALSSALLC